MSKILRLCFDLDDTLIPFVLSNWYTIKSSLRKENFYFDDLIVSKIKNASGDYLSSCDVFNKTDLLHHININIGFGLRDSFIDNWLLEMGSLVSKNIDSDLIAALNILRNEFDLVVLTDWFKIPQQERLRNCNLLQYFSSVYGIDNIRPKPSYDVYSQILSGINPENCIMIGDSIEKDVIGALNHGIRAIWYNPKNLMPPKDIKIPFNINNFKILPNIIKIIESQNYR